MWIFSTLGANLYWSASSWFSGISSPNFQKNPSSNEDRILIGHDNQIRLIVPENIEEYLSKNFFLKSKIFPKNWNAQLGPFLIFFNFYNLKAIVLRAYTF